MTNTENLHQYEKYTSLLERYAINKKQNFIHSATGKFKELQL